ncbi:hypothetical protein FQZ97_1208650 [compost metagenome]
MGAQHTRSLGAGLALGLLDQGDIGSLAHQRGHGCRIAGAGRRGGAGGFLGGGRSGSSGLVGRAAAGQEQAGQGETEGNRFEVHTTVLF